MRMVLVVMIWDFGKKKQMKYGTTSISLLNFNGQGNPGHSWLVELRPAVHLDISIRVVDTKPFKS